MRKKNQRLEPHKDKRVTTPRGMKSSQKRKAEAVTSALSVYTQNLQLKKQFEKLSQELARTYDRLEDTEIQINLLTRLLTTICIEKMGMRVGVLKRILKRVEKEAIRDSQILHLESLYKLPPGSHKKSSHPPKEDRQDPWEDVS